MARKRSLRHIDFVRYQEQNAFKKRLQACIVAICRQEVMTPYYENMLYRILAKLQAPSSEGVAMLPYEGHNFRSKNIRPELQLRRHHKFSCLITTVAFIWMQWWNYQSMLVSSGRLNHMVNYLESIVDKGLDTFNVVGNVRKGWRLHG